jgi:hypothetical protein
MAAKPPARVDEDGFLCLTGDRFWKWRAVDVELRAGLVELDSVGARGGHHGVS